MALKGKIETEVEIKATPEKFYNTFRSTAHHVPKISSHVQGVDVHQGDWETHGSIKIWKYTVEGKAEVLKEKVELNDAIKLVTLVGLEGDPMRIYKTFKASYNPTPKGNGSLVKIAVEYEKLNETVPFPTKYIDIMVNITKDIDAHFLKA